MVAKPAIGLRTWAASASIDRTRASGHIISPQRSSMTTDYTQHLQHSTESCFRAWLIRHARRPRHGCSSIVSTVYPPVAVGAAITHADIRTCVT